jgi:hypothetical protein
MEFRIPVKADEKRRFTTRALFLVIGALAVTAEIV